MEASMQITELGPLAWEAMLALTTHYGPAIDHAAEEIGIPFGEWYGWLMASRIFEPDPVSAARLAVRSAYTSPARLAEGLMKGVRLGLLEPAADESAGEYRLTAAGHAAVQRLIDTAYAAMTPLRPLPQADLDRLANLLYRLVLASLAAPEPPGKWCLRTARHYDPGESAPAMVRMDQYLSDLYAYRDDAHLAAWRPHGTSGQAWDALTQLWRGAAATPEELATRLARRGYRAEDYALALAHLASRGWARESGGRWHITEAGQAVREEAEAATDHYFYAPWACLDAAEQSALADLLMGLRDGLNRLRA
jgi:hypothetical protein